LKSINKKKIIAKSQFFLILILVISLMLSACSNISTESEDTITVVDSFGREVQVPSNPQAIATLDPFAGQVVISLGFGDKMPATVNGVKRDKLLQDICPSLAEAEVVKDSGSVSGEAVLSLGIDLMYVKSDMYTNESEREKQEYRSSSSPQETRLLMQRQNLPHCLRLVFQSLLGDF
jgi:iron complex transport system substrate-binding protein